MEINITKLFADPDFRPSYYSAGRAELGDNAGRITWENAVDATEEKPLLSTPEQFDAMRAFTLSSGGWNEIEVANFSESELNALLLQWISGDIRETPSGVFDDMARPDWRAYFVLVNEGQAAGRIYPGDDGQVYFSLEG